MNANELLDGLKKDVEKNILAVAANFGRLDDEQINFKPDKGKWSVGECIEHLNIYDHLYLVRFRKVLISGKKEFLSRDHYKPSFLGNYFIKQVDPKNITQNFSAPRVFQPSQSKISSSVIGEFFRQQNLVKGILDKAKRYSLKKNKIYTPATDLVKLRFGDALIIVVRHDERHIGQALRVINSENFPKKEPKNE